MEDASTMPLKMGALSFCGTGKRLENFKHNYSHNPRTRKRQETRFKRYCQRVFKTNKPNPITSLDDQLVAGKRYRFLFLQSQFINKPIKHLKYNKKSHLSNPQDYKFRVPFFSFSSSTRGRINVVENVSTLADSFIRPLSTEPGTESNSKFSEILSFPTVDNFDPLPPTVTIMKHLRAFVPNHLIYRSGKNKQSYSAPGSKPWFKFIEYQTNKITRPLIREDTSAEASARRLQAEILEEQKVMKILADYHGTTPKHMTRREIASVELTNFTEIFHEKMNGFVKRCKNLQLHQKKPLRKLQS
ncbi:hypothetical protein RhiirA4_426440 [Rhizophagus irregularis]|uniref:DUF8211 domain-containing protein n=1 Tax=Rhizophagus irregularis TaxID=588596 RepID=A0A2I1H538_9GLOM|nr:hypothetical protein RhiirA4_426440 [Rhizophagus irregularis]